MSGDQEAGGSRDILGEKPPPRRPAAEMVFSFNTRGSVKLREVKKTQVTQLPSGRAFALSSKPSAWRASSKALGMRGKSAGVWNACCVLHLSVLSSPGDGSLHQNNKHSTKTVNAPPKSTSFLWTFEGEGVLHSVHGPGLPCVTHSRGLEPRTDVFH